MTTDPTRLRALVIDDTPGIHDDFRKILCPRGETSSSLAELEAAIFAEEPDGELRTCFELDSAYQGDEAIRMVEEAVAAGDPYAVAFIDVRMPPGLNGIETLARIWKIDPRLQAVVCTAYSDHSWEDMIRTLGHSDGLLVLRKPFDAIEVLQIAHALSRKWQLSRAVERQLADLERQVARRTSELESSNTQLRNEIAERCTAQAELKKLATCDALTGLPNRLLLRDRVEQAIHRARRHGNFFALMLLDLDHFKEVNDSYGHPAGDELLVIVADRLQEAVRATDTVARLGGDEFVVIAEELHEPAGAAIVARRILDACAQPIEVAGHAVRTPASIGIAVFPNDCADAEGLLKSADLAMYQAKGSGRGYTFFTADMVVTSLAKMELREQLEHAVERGELALWYQPLLDVSSGAVTGMEALLRWNHPTMGLVSPARFIPEAEQSGLIVPIGAWVLRTACAQLRAWRDAGMTDLTVAVNVSPRQLHASDLAELVASTLTEYGLPPSCLEIEITETAAMTDFDQAMRVLGQLAAIGVRVAIDDFGSGYSSLVRLKEMPIHAIKIDRFFVRDLVDDPRNAAIVMAIVTMAHSLGIDVVAEGVERMDQFAFLQHMDWSSERRPICDRVQGFLFSRPLPVEGATTLLRQHLGRPSEPCRLVS